MDILISSNLERLIYTIAGQDGQKNAELMDALKSSGAYEITKEMKANWMILWEVMQRRNRQHRQSTIHINVPDM